MAMQQTDSRSTKSSAWTALMVFGLFVLCGNLDRAAAHQSCSLAAGAPKEAFGILLTCPPAPQVGSYDIRIL